MPKEALGVVASGTVSPNIKHVESIGTIIISVHLK